MLNDIIAKFSENKQINSFDFSLRPTHDIDNPYTNISLNILDNMEIEAKKADKNVLLDILLDEAEENINFSYKIYSQIKDLAPQDEGLLFKARLFEILNQLDDAEDESAYGLLIDFSVMLASIVNRKIHENKLENAFITIMLLFETVEEMKIRNMHLNYILDYKDFLTNQLVLLHIIATKLSDSSNKNMCNFFVRELLSYVNKFYNDANIDMCFDMLFFASLASDKNDTSHVKSAVNAIKKYSNHTSISSYEAYVNTGLKIVCESPDTAVNYANNKVKYLHGIEMIAHTLMVTKQYNLAADLIENALTHRKVSHYYHFIFSKLLYSIYDANQEKEKLAYAAKELFLLGVDSAYYTAVHNFKEIGKYEQEKYDIHEAACKKIPLYDYATILADSTEYDLLVDRFHKVKSVKDIKEAIKFMDDLGVALYDGETNKKLLQILESKAGRYPKLHSHVKSLLELIMI